MHVFLSTILLVLSFSGFAEDLSREEKRKRRIEKLTKRLRKFKARKKGQSSTKPRSRLMPKAQSLYFPLKFDLGKYRKEIGKEWKSEKSRFAKELKNLEEQFEKDFKKLRISSNNEMNQEIRSAVKPSLADIANPEASNNKDRHPLVKSTSLRLKRFKKLNKVWLNMLEKLRQKKESDLRALEPMIKDYHKKIFNFVNNYNYEPLYKHNTSGSRISLLEKKSICSGLKRAFTYQVNANVDAEFFKSRIPIEVENYIFLKRDKYLSWKIKHLEFLNKTIPVTADKTHPNFISLFEEIRSELNNSKLERKKNNKQSNEVKSKEHVQKLTRLKKYKKKSVDNFICPSDLRFKPVSWQENLIPQTD